MSERIKLQFNISEWNKLGLNYWGIPKCANTTIKYALLKKVGAKLQKIDEISQWVHSATMAKYITIEQALQNGYTNATVVGNPYTRFISMFKDVQRRPKHFGLEFTTIDSFLDYLEKHNLRELNLHFWPQTYFLVRDDKLLVDRAIKMEELNDKGFMGIEVQHLNSTKGTIELTSQQKKRIAKLYDKDFTFLGYEK